MQIYYIYQLALDIFHISSLRFKIYYIYPLYYRQLIQFTIISLVMFPLALGRVFWRSGWVEWSGWVG